ncbi:hypothetical protein F2P81_021030 [Scophthalmus maximus]|uniref:Uncharacterized protein n=1 Tax=Scophthalmus maximus TaxID=52904 RepID=A0A6A4RW62_SCOMX|nr:hypothetical protein F2P81_021030 [Scophthalmus maximus]
MLAAVTRPSQSEQRNSFPSAQTRISKPPALKKSPEPVLKETFVANTAFNLARLLSSKGVALYKCTCASQGNSRLYENTEYKALDNID